MDLRGAVEDSSLVILDANYAGSAINIQDYSGDGDIVFEGFTIINGYATDGGGVYVYNAFVSISNCVFHNDISTGAGGAFSVYSPTGDIIIEKSGGSPKQPVGRVVFFEVDDENTQRQRP